jgi:hypothetical protein
VIRLRYRVTVVTKRVVLATVLLLLFPLSLAIWLVQEVSSLAARAIRFCVRPLALPLSYALNWAESETRPAPGPSASDGALSLPRADGGEVSLAAGELDGGTVRLGGETRRLRATDRGHWRAP